jgi:hypothetical protein
VLIIPSLFFLSCPNLLCNVEFIQKTLGNEECLFKGNVKWSKV